MGGRATRITRYINNMTGEYYDKVQPVTLQFDDDGYLFWKNKGNVKVYLDESLPICFTWSERGRIDAIKHYILTENQLLVYRSGNSIKPIMQKELCKLLDLSDRQCKAFVRKLKAYGVIKEIYFDSMRYFAFNPKYAFKGKRLSLNVYIFFQDELNDVLPTWVQEQFYKQAMELKPDIRVVR